MAEVTREEVIKFTTEHLSWIHRTEEMANRRLTDHEILMLRDLELINNWDTRLQDLTNITTEINGATANFVEGILE